MSLKRKSGFTLIELLVVIAIISLLVSILLPSLSKAKALALMAVCQNCEKNLGNGFLLYAEDYNGQISHVGGNWGYTFHYALRLYVDMPMDWDTYHKRGYNSWDEDAGTYSNEVVGYTAPGLSCPVKEEYGDGGPTGNYALNYDGNVDPHFACGYGETVSLFEMDPTTFLVTDARDYYIYSPLLWGLNIDPNGDGKDTTYSGVYSAHHGYLYNSVRPRHMTSSSTEGSITDRSINLLFSDMHVEPQTFEYWLDNENHVWGPPQ